MNADPLWFASCSKKMIFNHVLDTVRKADVRLTYKIWSSFPKGKSVVTALHSLEWSCHGIPWLVTVISLIYMFPQNIWFRHLLVGLIMDIVYVALLKAYARRRRPDFARQDDQFCVVSVDKHSFPSGHASRAIYFAMLCSDDSFLSSLVWLWAVAVAFSRVVLGRHHVGDVIAGMMLGVVEYVLQFNLGLPINSIVMWIISSLMQSQFYNTNDQSDGHIDSAVD